MKKTLLLAATLMLTGAMMAQSRVSTEVETRNVIIEEYTGVGCGYCPDGHARANAICESHEGHAWAINIHQGGYAAGSGYETQWGDGLAGQYSISGYPCGTVNRGTSMQDRGQWASAANTIVAQNSPVNMAASATIDPLSRTMTVEVEMYYTGDQTVTSNFLNVVLLQNNILGQQSNYGNYNSEYIEGSQYRHMHMLRDMLTGQWGEEITTVGSGTLVQRTYTYSIPNAIGAVEISNFEDLTVLAFVTETHKNIITGTKAEMSLIPRAYIASITCESVDCALDFQPVVTLANSLDVTVNSWTLVYEGEELTVNKTVAPGASDTVYMEPYSVVLSGDAVQNCSTTKTVSLAGYVTENNDTVESEPFDLTATFADFSVYTAEGPFVARVGIDMYGSEASVKFINQSSCSTVWSEGSWTDISGNSYKPARYYSIEFSPEHAGLYILRLLDSYGDGWTYSTTTTPSGIWLSNSTGELFSEIFAQDASTSFSQRDYYVNVTNDGTGEKNTTGIDDIVSIAFSISPNPASSMLNISCTEPIQEVNIMDMAGRSVMATSSTNSINVRGLANGVYIISVITEKGIGIQKFVKE